MAKKNTGANASYYELPADAEEIQDLIEYRDMNFAVGNIFKATYRLGQKDGTSDEYDLLKIVFYAVRELLRRGCSINFLLELHERFTKG